MKKFSFPSAQTILFIILGLVTLLTWFVPAGCYDKLSYDADTEAFIRTGQEGQETLTVSQETLDQLNIKIPLKNFTSGDIYKPIAIPGTYQTIEARPQGLAAFVKSPIRGIIEAADIIFLVLIIGGLIGIMNITGAFDAGIARLAEMLEGREFMLIILVTLLIALGGTTFGLAEETMAFFPILIPVFLSARYDAMVGLASIFLGSAIGTMFSTINPFSVIIASDAAGINWTTGLYTRLILLILALIITIAYIIRYAEKVKKDPTQSIIYDQQEEIRSLFHMKDGQAIELTGKLKLILLIFTASFIIMIIGVSRWDWWFIEMTATFLVASIIIGIIAGIKESKFIDAFISGAADLLGVAFIIGIARGVSVIMEDGMISDTMLYYASSVTEGMHKGLFINVMTFIFSMLSFFIPSSSGMAVLTMPIMSPLADTVGIGRELIVNAYQFGPGLFFILNPTGLILASLAIIKVGFDKWLKFIWPLVLILSLFVVIAMTTMVYLS